LANINPIIIAALSPLNRPVSPDEYIPPNEGDLPPDEYITFNYADERDVEYADDAPIADETTVQVHYFTKGDPHTNKKAIRKLLRSADFIINDTVQDKEIDTGYTHVIISASIGGDSDD
jgi:hypothetical protein